MNKLGIIGRQWNHEPAKTAQPIFGSAWLLTAHGLHFGSAGGLSRQSGLICRIYNFKVDTLKS